MTLSSVLKSFTIVSVLISLTGCMAVLAGGAAAGTVAYVRGDLQAVLEADISRSANAVERAGRDLELVAISDERDQTEAKLIFRTAGDRRIEVNLKRATDSTTNLSIRVGIFGDESLSREFYDRIRVRL